MNVDTTITDLETQETLEFPWGAIKWLCSEELIYVFSGQCHHSLGDEMHHLKPGMMSRIPQDGKHNAANNGWAPVTMVICYSSADRQTVFCE